MREFVLGGLLLGLPAVVVVVFLWGSPVMIPALASLLVVMLPFLAGGWILARTRKKGTRR